MLQCLCSGAATPGCCRSPERSASHRSFPPCPAPLLTATRPVPPLTGAKFGVWRKMETHILIPLDYKILTMPWSSTHSSRPKDNTFYAAYSVRAGDQSIIGEGKPNLSFPLATVRLDGQEKTRMLSSSWPPDGHLLLSLVKRGCSAGATLPACPLYFASFLRKPVEHAACTLPTFRFPGIVHPPW